MRNFRFPLILLIGINFLLIYQSCSTCSRRQTEITVELDDFGIDTVYTDMARKVLYALPTPIEMSFLIKNSGIVWNANLLNNPAVASKYLTNQKMALNFGVYMTDLTYAGLFEQSQAALRFKMAIQQLSEGLGLQAAINANTMRLLEDNINDKDEMMRIISDAYSTCMATLNESERFSLSLTILAGGWVESMYISTSSLDEKLLTNEERIKQLVIDQILTFDMLWQVLLEQSDIPDVQRLMKDFSGLASLYDNIGVSHTSNEVSVSEDSNITVIASSNVVKLTAEDFEKIKFQIQMLRNNFTNI